VLTGLRELSRKAEGRQFDPAPDRTLRFSQQG
jgi:hypothetical protein